MLVLNFTSIFSQFISECWSSWTSYFPNSSKKDGKLGFLILGLPCTSKFFQFTKELKHKQQKSWLNKINSRNFPIFWIYSTPSILYIKYSSKYKNSCYGFFFLHNFKLKTKAIIDWKLLLVNELRKFGV